MDPRIEIDPRIMFGKPVIRGTRIPVEQVLRELARGMKEDELVDQYPRLTREDVRAALIYAAEQLSQPMLAAE
jgi:uncharacterized protein (DUF433 family)